MYIYFFNILVTRKLKSNLKDIKVLIPFGDVLVLLKYEKIKKHYIEYEN